MRCSGQRASVRRRMCGSKFAATASQSPRSEEHTSELQSPCNLVCRLLLEKKKKHEDNHLLFIHTHNISNAYPTFNPQKRSTDDVHDSLNRNYYRIHIYIATHQIVYYYTCD